jgi:hypothetical protein
MRKTLPAFASALAVVLSVPAAAGGQVATQDSVHGSGTIIREDLGQVISYEVDARSGPSGENPAGTVAISVGGSRLEMQVVCLQVSGTTAIVGATTSASEPSGIFRIAEGSPDTIAQTVFAEFIEPDVCRKPLDYPAVPFDTGDFAIVDASPPSTYTQCRLGGWANYRFASHAECIAYVHALARKKCVFERAAHGLLTFRAKYGVGPNHDYAMRRCVRRYTGF